LIGRGDARGPRALGAAVRRTGPPALVAIAIGPDADGVLDEAPGRVRALQLACSPVSAAAGGVRAARAARVLRRAGLRVTVVPTGDRMRRHGLGPGIVRSQRRLPVGRIVVGTAGHPGRSVVEAAVAAAAGCLETRLRATAITALESGKLLVDVVDGAGGRWVLRLAARPARVQLDRGLAVLEKLAAARPDAPVRDRVAWPVAGGEVGPARWSLEHKAPGHHPRAMTARLWRDCHDFLVALHRLGAGDTTAEAAGLAELLRGQARNVGAHADAAGAAALERIASALLERLAAIPLGWAHGDFWAENLLVRRGRLHAVVDWDWARPHGLPVLDLMDLVALSRRRIRDVPPGRRLLETLWPPARAGGDERLRAYCAALGVPGDARTLEALAVAYWLDRTARDLRPFDDRAGRPAWLRSNIRAPLAALEAAGW
jgi:hypothetical protein